MGLFAETPKTKGCLNNNNLKNNRTPSALIEPFLKYSKKKKKITHTDSLSLICGEVQETATFFTVNIIWYCHLW